MYPAQTSFIPVTVALVRFAAENGFSGNYPYWYLGTTPFKYLTGPVVLYVLLGLKSIFGGLSYFDLALDLVLFSGLISAVGWGVFVEYLSGNRKLAILTGFLVLLAPWHWVFSLGLGETSAVLAGAFTPWVLFAYAISVRHNEKTFGHSLLRKQDFIFGLTQASARQYLVRGSNFVFGLASSSFSLWLPSLAFAFLLLTNTVASIPVILGMVILSISNFKFIISKLKIALWVLLLGWFFTLWWYSPNYWLNLLFAPSIGGKSALGAFGSIFGFLRLLAPIILAVGVVSFKFGKWNKFEKFAAVWLFTFVTFSLFRMLSDIDFWMDWTAWMGEVEVGIALILAGKLAQIPSTKHQITNNIQNLKIKIQNLSIFRFRIWDLFGIWNLVIVILLIGGWSLAWQKRDFWLPRRSIENTVEFKIARWLEKNVRCQMSDVRCQTVFLSGSTAFWLNSLVDVTQVRGGVDQASVDSAWRKVVWEVREGASAQRSYDALKGLDVSYLVVHGAGSKEYYHDFSNVEKYKENNFFEKVYDADGDVIYKIN